MKHVKTAISLRKDLFIKANQVAREMNISRSQLIEQAFEQFVQRNKDRDIRRIIESQNAERSHWRIRG